MRSWLVGRMLGGRLRGGGRLDGERGWDRNMWVSGGWDMLEFRCCDWVHPLRVLRGGGEGGKTLLVC